MTAKKMCTHLHEYVIKPLNEKYDRVITNIWLQVMGYNVYLGKNKSSAAKQKNKHNICIYNY